MLENKTVWEKQLNVLGWLVHYLFLTPAALVAVIYFLYPPHPVGFNYTHESLFYWLIAAGLMTFPIMGWLHRQLISLESLEMRTRGVGIESAFSAFRIGLILSASFGELCVALGIVFYLMAREPERAAVFIGLWGCHYILASVWLRRGFDDFTLLTRPRSTTAETRSENVNLGR